MKEQIVRLFKLLQPREKRKLWWLAAAMVVMGALEVIGVSSIFPFIAVVSKPEIIQGNRWLRGTYGYVHASSTQEFLLYLGGFVLAAIVASNLFAAFVTWLVLRFSHGLGHEVSARMLRAYLAKSYPFFLGRSTLSLTLSAIDEVAGLVNGVAVPALQTLTKTIVAVMLLALLMVVDFWLALCVAVSVGGVYAAIFFAFKTRLTVLGNRAGISNRQRRRYASDVLLGIKELKILQRERYYQMNFERSSLQHANDQIGYGLIATLPRYAIEILAFGGILMILLYLIAMQRDFAQALPLIALYAVAGYRLMPAVQQIFGGVSQLRFGLASIDALYRDMEYLRDDRHVMSAAPQPALHFEEEVALRDVVFAYPGAQRPALDHVNLRLPKNTTVGVVGATGSGKTTAIDVLLGLLEPQSGTLSVDGQPISGVARSAWQRRIGYVPQVPYIVDDSIRRNIALGIPDSEIDESRLREAARVANLDRFIENDLPERYDTQVGERGTRLSGGQRQRMCIARALYHDPDVVVFDEATSALDAPTEDAIIEAMRSLAHRKTIIMIAHRLVSLADCDNIYVFERGRIVDQGDFEGLRASSQTFRTLARSGAGA